MTPKERAAMQQALEALRNVGNALMVIAAGRNLRQLYGEMRDDAVNGANKAITALREALEQFNCQCGDKCFPIFSGDIEYCEACGKPTALAEQVHTPYCKQAPMCKTPCGNSDCVEQAEQEPVAWMPRAFPVTPNWKSTVNSSETALYCKPLYTRPVRTKDLTDEEIRELFANEKQVYAEEGISFARAVITKFKEKNK